MTDVSRQNPIRGRELAYRSVHALKPNPRNARTHSKKQIGQIAASIKEFGFTNPVLIDSDDRVVAGHGRVAAAKQLGIDRVPVIGLKDLSEAQIRAYVLADNKLAENAGWDKDLLATALTELAEFGIDVDLSITGFDTAEIDLLIGNQAAASRADEADNVPCIETGRAIVARAGDLWQLGRHRLFCGDATQASAYERLFGNERAQLVFTDPPYNVPIVGHVSGLGRVQHREFAMASGEMSETEFSGFLGKVFANLASFSADGSIHYVCMDWRHMGEVLAGSRGVYSELKNLCFWNKTNGGMGSLYRSKHELIFVFKNGTAAHINNVELGKKGRYRTNVWDYPGVNSFRSGRSSELEMHPTVKPVALVADAIRDCSRRGGIVLDCFSGSGTTLIAAERTERRGYAIEMDPVYVDVAIERFQQLTGEEAVHLASGFTFENRRLWHEVEGLVQFVSNENGLPR